MSDLARPAIYDGVYHEELRVNSPRNLLLGVMKLTLGFLFEQLDKTLGKFCKV